MAESVSEPNAEEKGLHQLVRLVGLSQGVQPPLTLVISIVIARSLGPEGRGAYGLVVATVAMLPLVLGIGLEQAVRYWAARGQVDRDRLLKTSTLVAVSVGLVAAAIALGVWAFEGPDWLVPPDLGPLGIAALASALFLAALRAYWVNFLIGQERYGFSTWGVNAATALQAAVLASLWLADAVSLETVLLAFVLQFTFSFVLFFFMAGRELARALRARTLPRREILEMFRYGRWQYLAAVLNQTNMRISIFLLAALAGFYETGLYTAVSGPAGFLGLVAAPFNIVLTSRTARRAEDPDFPRRVAGALRLIALLMTLAALAAAVVAPYLLPWIFGEEFRPAVRPFWILLPGMIVFSQVVAIAQYLAGARRPEWNTRISALAAVLTIGLNLLLIPGYGALGAAAAFACAYAATFFLAVFAFLRVGRIGVRELVTFRAADWTPLARVVSVGPLKRFF